MLTPTSKLFLPISGVALFLGAFYKIISGDLLGSVLFLMVGVVAFLLGVMLSSVRENEYAPAVAPNAPPPGVRAVAVAPLPGGGGWPVLGGLAFVLIMLGLIEHPLFTWGGVLVGLVASAGWLARSASEATGRPISLAPVGLPILGLTTIASVMFFLSRILLAVNETASWVIALVVGVIILGSASIAAVRPNISSRTMVAILVTGTLVMVGGGIYAAAQGERSFEHSEESAGGGAAVAVKAEGVAFKTAEIDLAHDADVEIHFTNADKDVQHNIAIFGADASKPVFRGQLVTGVSTVTYSFHSPPPGEYRFQCEVHPTMKGTVKVA